MEKLLSILAIVKSQGVPPSSEKLHLFLYPLQSQEHGKGAMAELGQGLGLLPSGPWRTLTLKDQIRCHRSTSMKSLYKDVRTLDLQVMLVWGQRGKLSSPYSQFAEHQRCFYHPYESMIISISVWSDFPETTLELFFSGIFCKICSGHARSASG